MADRWTVTDPLPGRHQPDGAERPPGRIEPGTLLIELDRLGAWVRVETPGGRRWWVDGRRLQAVDVSPTKRTVVIPAAAAPAEPDQAGAPLVASSRRWPLPLVAIVVAATALLVAGAVMLRGSVPDPPTAVNVAPPTVLRGTVPLHFKPYVVGVQIPAPGTFYMAGTRLMTGVRLWDDTITLSTFDTSTILDAVAAVLTGPVALTFRPEIILFDHDTGVEVDGVALPDAKCCANVLAGNNDGQIVAFPERGGRSDAYWEIDLEEGTWGEYPLPAPITVTSAITYDAILYVGHTNGLIAISRFDDCRGEIASWDVPTAALSIAVLDSGARVSALDIQNQVIAVVDHPSMLYLVEGCGPRRVPRLQGIVDLKDVVGGAVTAYQPALATVGTAAYVIDREGLIHVVDIGTPSADVESRLIENLLIPDSPTRGASLAALRDGTSDLWSVFVIDRDGSRMSWIASTGDESPDRIVRVARR